MILTLPASIWHVDRKDDSHSVDDYMKLDSGTQTLSRHSHFSYLPTLLQYNAIYILPINQVGLWWTRQNFSNLQIEFNHSVQCFSLPFCGKLGQWPSAVWSRWMARKERHSARLWGGGGNQDDNAIQANWNGIEPGKKEQFNIGPPASKLGSHYLSQKRLK